MTRPFVPLPVPRARRVAVIGGSRVPFARSDGPYATASNQDLLTAALNGLVERYGLALATGSGRSSRARSSSTAAISIWRARPSSAPPSILVPRRTTYNRRAAPVSRRSSPPRTPSPSAPSTRRSRAAPTPRATPRSASTTNCAASCSPPAARSPPEPASRPFPPYAPATSSRTSRATRNPAPACRWATTPPSPPAAGRSPARTRTCWPPRATSAWPPRTNGASWTTWWSRTGAWTATRTCAPARRSRNSPR